jgi:hypothetical protein
MDRKDSKVSGFDGALSEDGDHKTVKWFDGTESPPRSGEETLASWNGMNDGLLENNLAKSWRVPGENSACTE